MAALATPLLAQIPPGFELVQITNDGDLNDPYDINDCGQIVFAKRAGFSWSQAEIYLYDNGRTMQLTDNSDVDFWPRINERGVVAWTRGFGEDCCYQVVKLEDGLETVVAQGSNFVMAFDIGANGEIAWGDWTNAGCRGTESEIHILRDGVDERITSGGYSHQDVTFNTIGDLVFTRFDFCPNPWESDIFLHSGGQFQQITVDEVESQSPSLNNLGHVVWSSQGQPTDFIWKWVQGEKRMVTDWGAGPSSNDLGDVAFRRWHENFQQTRACLFHDDAVWELTHGPQDAWCTGINRAGEVIIKLRSGDSAYEVLFLRRTRDGDLDNDMSIDRGDYASFPACMTGPQWPARLDPDPQQSLCECRFLDIDYDGDIDLQDVSLFMNNFGDE